MTRASTAPAQHTEGVWVTGSGRFFGPVGVVEVVLVSLSTCPAAAQALRENTARIQQVAIALNSAGVAASDMQTLSMTVVPLYAQAQVDTPAVAGYRMASSLRVIVRDAAHLGDLLDKAAAAGAQIVQSIQLLLADQAAAHKSAIDAALADAHSKATDIAGSLGRQLGPAVTVLEEGSPFAAAQAQAPAPAGASVSTLALEARLQVLFRLT